VSSSRGQEGRGGGTLCVHPHLHCPVTEGGTDKKGAFHKVLRFNDDRLAEVFAQEVLGFLVGREFSVAYPDFYTGHEEMRIIDAAVESAKMERWVRV